MIKRISSVLTSPNGRTYATDIKGNALFTRNEAIQKELATGKFAYVIEERQTMTRDENGDLVPLPEDKQRNILIITAVFNDRNEALEANGEEISFEQETQLYVTSKLKEMKKTYKLEDADIADLVNA